MEEYQFKEKTLLHGIGFNPFKLESILKNGILSKESAKNKKITFSKNYEGYNFDNYISMVRPFYYNSEVDSSSFKKFSLKGISLVVEDQEFIYDINDMYFNYSDEVYVLDEVPLDKIKGIIIPDEYEDYELRDLPMIPLKSTSYVNLKYCCDNIINYLKSYDYEVDQGLYNTFLNELYHTIEAYKIEKDDSLLDDFTEAKEALDEFIALEVQNCFDEVLRQDNTTIYEVINFINKKTLNLPIYTISNSKKKER